MATKIDKIQQRKTTLLAKLKELQAEESKAVSVQKTARREEDTRTKVLLGIMTIAHINESPEAAIPTLARHADKLTPLDRKFLATSQLWKELGFSAPHQDAAKTAPQATKKASPIPAVTQALAPPGTAPAATRTATTATPLTQARYQDREEVKTLGALYSADSKMWFVQPGSDLKPFEKWL